MNKSEEVKCPTCNNPATYDMSCWPPKIEGAVQIIHYECACGERFVRKITVKTKGALKDGSE